LSPEFDEEFMSYDEYSLEVQNRLQNLVWTVSGNYDLIESADVESFFVSKYIAMYDAIWKGAFAKYFDKNEMALYIAKKIYLGAEKDMLLTCVQLCSEVAGYKKVASERAGIDSIREQAYEDMIEYSFDRLSQTLDGRIRLAMIRYYKNNETEFEARLKEPLELILSLADAVETTDVIIVTDMLYNNHFDFGFERRYGSLSDVLAVTIDELRTNKEWLEFLNDEIYNQTDEPDVDQNINQISEVMMNMSSLTEQEKVSSKAKRTKIVIDEESLAKVARYIEINYGKSYLTPLEAKRINASLCYGLHSECSIHFTKGVLAEKGPNNYQRKYNERQLEKNMIVYYDNHRIIRKNVTILTDILKNEMVLHDQVDHRVSDTGDLATNKLWRVGRTRNNKLFYQVTPASNYEFVVEILIDGSGSQSTRQAKVAMQSFIISEALSNLNIPHRVMSYCSFWDHAIMRLFRDYDDDRKNNIKIMGFTTSSNNRDGLAIRAATQSLQERKEGNKILIVLSDGKPNDVLINHPTSTNTVAYTGDIAVRDTAYEVRKVRSMGISVLGVFAGKEAELPAEKRIFGKDFAYIRDISNFSKLVGMYLKKQIENI
jgi:hypothetical protein